MTPIQELDRRLSEVTRAMHEADRANVREHGKNQELSARFEKLNDECVALWQAIIAAEPQDLRDVVIQLLVNGGMSPEGDLTDIAVTESKAALLRMLFRMVPIIATAAGIDPMRVGAGDHWHPSWSGNVASLPTPKH